MPLIYVTDPAAGCVFEFLVCGKGSAKITSMLASKFEFSFFFFSYLKIILCFKSVCEPKKPPKVEKLRVKMVLWEVHYWI